MLLIESNNDGSVVSDIGPIRRHIGINRNDDGKAHCQAGCKLGKSAPGMYVHYNTQGVREVGDARKRCDLISGNWRQSQSVSFGMPRESCTILQQATRQSSSRCCGQCWMLFSGTHALLNSSNLLGR